MTVFVIILFFALIGQTIIWLIWAWEKRENQKVIMQEGDTPASWPSADVDLKIVFQQWGKTDPREVKLAGPVHESISNVLKTYASIGPDEYFLPVNRDRIATPWQNPEYVQIGEWGDGSEVLAKRDPCDQRIYVAEAEDANAGKPMKAAESIDQFLKKAWAYHKASTSDD